MHSAIKAWAAAAAAAAAPAAVAVDLYTLHQKV